jgi:hypothetical protein
LGREDAEKARTIAGLEGDKGWWEERGREASTKAPFV